MSGDHGSEGVGVTAVLGVSVTPSTVGLVLVEGSDGNGATLHHETVDVRNQEPGQTRDQVVAAVTRSAAIATELGRRLQTFGVTRSDQADVDDSTLPESLAEAGFGKIVPVRLSDATDALARGIADAVHFDTTAVCVLEPDVVLAMTAGAPGDPVRTSVGESIETVRGLTDWLVDVYASSEPRPNGLVVVGSAVDLDSVLPKLEAALSIPVFTPAEPGLALARGAALAAARRDGPATTAWRSFTKTQLTRAAVLAAGVVTFIVSLSLAIGHQMGSDPAPAPRLPRQVVNTSGTPAAVRNAPTTEVPAAPAPAPVVQEAAPVPVAPTTTPPVEQAVSEPSADPVPAAPVDITDPQLPAAPPPASEPVPPVTPPGAGPPPPEVAAAPGVPPPPEGVPPPPQPEAPPPPPPQPEAPPPPPPQ
ncbi:DUF7159 family protein, partial [Mycobacterium sp. NPDC003449]